jgi:hypothetical protein
MQSVAIAGARCAGTAATGCGSGGVYDSSKTISYIQNLGNKYLLTIPATNVTLNNNAQCGA